jgi:hypothetical protein
LLSKGCIDFYVAERLWAFCQIMHLGLPLHGLVWVMPSPLGFDPTLSLWIESENLIMVRQYGQMKSSFGVADSTTLKRKFIFNIDFGHYYEYTIITQKIMHCNVIIKKKT